MQVEKNTVVTLTYTLTDTDGEVLEHSDEPVSYLHGGYDGIFQPVEAAIEGCEPGGEVDLTLEPADAFGEYDAELVRVEPRNLFPEDLSVGMQFEGVGAEGGDARLYTVTDIVEDRVVVDGNHPLAGERLRVQCRITAVRVAQSEEIAHGHVHGAHGHHHH
jgi:FKBP-type peptidyl-prolyl cis-trans isomerase SlyD